MTDLKKDKEQLLGPDINRPWWKKWSSWFLLVLIVGAGVAFWYWNEIQGSSKVNFATADVSQGPLVVEVTANGTLSPIRTVSIGSELSGIVRQVNVDVNDEVKTGDVLIQLDDTKLRASVERAKANLELSKADLIQAQATLKEAKAKLSRLQEVRRLSGGKSPSKTELDTQEATVAIADANVASAKAKILDSEEALKSAENDLSKTRIVSPIDGVVLARSVENGYAVAASLQAVELLTLATDMKKLELQVNVDEADVGAVKPGQPAYFTVSAYPDRRFPAQLNKVAYGSKQTDKTDNVVTYVTYLYVDNPDLDLRPGMTATANIRTVFHKDAVLVPNTALRFKPKLESGEAAKGSSMSMFGGHPRRTISKQVKDEKSSGEIQKEGSVYILKDGKPTELKLIVGNTDGKNTEVLKGDLKPGDKVIINQLKESKK